MKYKYTKHAKKKFSDLKIFGIIVKKSQISNTVRNPKFRALDNGNFIASSNFDKKHNLRVVYKEAKDVIIIITFYIYRKGRYDEN